MQINLNKKLPEAVRIAIISWELRTHSNLYNCNAEFLIHLFELQWDNIDYEEVIYDYAQCNSDYAKITENFQEIVNNWVDEQIFDLKQCNAIVFSDNPVVYLILNGHYICCVCSEFSSKSSIPAEYQHYNPALYYPN
jgi:hypothetical protein